MKAEDRIPKDDSQAAAGWARLALETSIKELIEEHVSYKPLDSTTLLKICLDTYAMGLEDARQHIKNLIATDNMAGAESFLRVTQEESSAMRRRKTDTPT